MNGFGKAFISFGVAVFVHSALAWGLFTLNTNDRRAPVPLSGFEVVELPSSAATQHIEVQRPNDVEPNVEDVQAEAKPPVETPIVPRPIPIPKPVSKPIIKPQAKPTAIPEPKAKPQAMPKTVFFKESNTMATQLAYIPPSQHAAYLKNPKPAYPTQARKRGMEGRVILRVFVKADGGVKSVEMQQSSGYELLDRAARVAVLRWRFEPATRGGHVVDGEVLIPFDFRLTPG